LFARDPAMLRRAAAVAARHVRSDREHAVELMDYYAGLIAAKHGVRRTA